MHYYEMLIILYIFWIRRSIYLRKLFEKVVLVSRNNKSFTKLSSLDILSHYQRNIGIFCQNDIATQDICSRTKNKNY